MSDDVIYRQEAIDAINHICPVDTEYDCTLLDRVDVRYVLSDLPSAQPEIIRCKDCKYSSHEPYKDQADVYVCNYSYWTRAEGGRYPDWYCARAERRTDERSD